MGGSGRLMIYYQIKIAPPSEGRYGLETASRTGWHKSTPRQVRQDEILYHLLENP